ncbi:PAS domain-containing sensor histidine kinase [Lacinutrix sp. Hel_I_90]|uniref:sensor histidine kinase n=1 Tax=Lacinutrix sp. Hel_I_90 TaxID=1249999 RepID=UPI0005C8A303
MFQNNQDIFQILAEAISEGILIVDEHQNIVGVNSSTETMFGYEKDELLQKPLSTLIPSNYHESHVHHFNTFYKHSEKRTMGKGRALFGSKKSGATFPVEVGLNPFSIYDKTYVMALVIDITERKEKERDLMMKSEALQSASNGIIITDALEKDNPIIYFNPAFAKLTGYSEAEILNKNCRFLQADDRDQESVRALRKAVKQGKSCQTTIRNYKKDGTLFWNDLNITPVKDKSGVITHFIGIQNDVTEQKISEQERNHLATIFDESLNEIFVFDAKTLKFINVNYGAQKNIGYTLAELKKMTPLDIKPDFSKVAFQNVLKPLLDGSKENIEFETRHQRHDRSFYPVQVHLQLSTLGDKSVFVAIIMDITELKNYTQRLEHTVEERTKQLKEALETEKELNELKTKFLSLVSHEFKTPLAGILTSTMLLSKYTLEAQQDKRDKHIETITKKVHYLDTILNDFLSVEKLETGKVIYKFTTFKLSKVVNEVIYNANMLLKEGQKINYPENIDEITLTQDEKTIELSLSNLVHNAIKYSPEYTTIELNIHQDKNQTVFKVIDNGIGIPIRDQKNIFNRYFRAENALLSQGTGIGLNIVKTHLENLGGSIHFISQENQGSTFTMRIPNTPNQ